MFQTEMLFRDVLNEALLCVANRQNSCESHTLFERVSSYIHEYYHQSLTIPLLAEQYNVNRNRLSYVFRKHAGMGPAEYLLKYRINMAQKCFLQVMRLYNILRKLLELLIPFILVECLRNNLVFLLLNIERSSSIIHANFNKHPFKSENSFTILIAYQR